MKHCFRQVGWLKMAAMAVAFVVAAVSCTGAAKADNRQGKAAETEAVEPAAAEGQAEEEVKFVFPVVPESIQEPRERLNYTLEHFWDKWAFADTTATNWTVGEQGFADFLNLLQYADSTTAARVVGRYIDNGFAHYELRSRYEGLIDHYLGDPNSPLRNDVIYAHFLRKMLPCYTVEEMAMHERAAFRLSVVTKNNPGTVATDFEYIDRQGRHGRLSTVKGELIVLLFNDPDCEKCKLLMPQLLQEPRLQRPGITVLAIYPDVDTQLWKKETRDVPANWIDAYSPKGEIMMQQLYSLPAMPSLYLLDERHRVLMKDVEPQTLMNVLAEHERRKGI